MKDFMGLKKGVLLPVNLTYQMWYSYLDLQQINDPTDLHVLVVYY